jgi:hypothetical protein
MREWKAWCINPLKDSNSWLVSNQDDDGNQVEGTKQYRADSKESALRLAEQLTSGITKYSREQVKCMEVTGFILHKASRTPEELQSLKDRIEIKGLIHDHEKK